MDFKSSIQFIRELRAQTEFELAELAKAQKEADRAVADFVRAVENPGTDPAAQ